MDSQAYVNSFIYLSVYFTKYFIDFIWVIVRSGNSGQKLSLKSWSLSCRLRSALIHGFQSFFPPLYSLVLTVPFLIRNG